MDCHQRYWRDDGAKRNRVKTKERGSINTNTNWVILIHTIPLFFK